MAAICRFLLNDLDELADRITAVIAGEVTEFGEASIYSRRELWDMSRATVRAELRGLGDRRPPGPDELQVLRLTGRNACAGGLPLRALIDAYHVGQRELWHAFLEAAEHMDNGAQELLLTASDYLLERMIVLSSASVDEYQRTAAELDVAGTRTAVQFVRALESDPGSKECRMLAGALGFDPEGPFRAVVTVTVGAPGQPASAVIEGIRESGGVAVGVERAGSRVLILQIPDAIDLGELLTRVGPPAGIGMGHTGLLGARESMTEAHQALGVAVYRQSVCWFEIDWLPATALARRGSFEKVLEPAVHVATEYPYLGAAVRAFARRRFSVAGAARELLLSHTGTKSRLLRWVELTGLDIWTHEGLTSSLLACDLADMAGDVTPLRPGG